MNSVRSRPSPLPTYDVCPVRELERQGGRETWRLEGREGGRQGGRKGGGRGRGLGFRI